MKNLLSFYNSEEKQLKNKLLKVKKNLKILSLLRLTVFILTVVSIYLLFENTLITTVILIVGGSSFYFLVVKYSNEKLEKNLLNCKIEINQTEIAVLNGDFSFLPKVIQIHLLFPPFLGDIQFLSNYKYLSKPFQYLK